MALRTEKQQAQVKHYQDATERGMTAGQVVEAAGPFYWDGKISAGIPEEVSDGGASNAVDGSDADRGDGREGN